MLLRTLMEDKQLDFNQPLLSVRRFSPTVALEKDDKKKTDNSLPSVPPLPYYKSELKSGPVSNPGTVPFIWEQSPGRPKNESKHQTKGLERPPIAPKLPPGRSKKVEQAHPSISEHSTVTGSEARKVASSSRSLPSIEENTMKIESSKDAVEEKESSDSGDSEEAYLDALDTLSRTESCFLNCSLSGLSGLDEQVAKRSGAFSADPVTRDFMMYRFLPAAKAMAYETSQHASRKQPVVQEQPREVKKVIGGHTRPPLLRPRPNILPNYPEDNTEEQSDDSGDDYNEPGNLSTTVCGFLPKFCLLNPVPAISVRTRVSRHPVDKAQARSTSDVSSQKTKKHIGSSHEQRSLGGTQNVDLAEKYALRKKSDQVPNQSNFQKFQATSLYSRLQGNGITPQQNELPQSSFCEENRFSGSPQVKEGEKRSSNDFHELLADRGTIREILTETPVIEKTLYVDSVHKMFSPKSSLSSSDRKGSSNSVNCHFEIIAKVNVSAEIPSVNSSCRDFENSNVMDKDVVLQPKSLDPVDSVLLSLPGKSDEEGMNEHICQESITSANLKLSSSGHADIEDQQHLTKVKNVVDSPELNSQCPLPPPLPKSPSESWLWRTLPSMPSRKSSSHSYLGTRINSPHLASKIPGSIPKTKFQRQP